MNVLFLSLLNFESLQERNIYTDMLREFVKNGHTVYAISPLERRLKQNTHLIKEENVVILRLKIGNIQKTNVIEKGISTLMIERQYIRGIKKYFCHMKFDLILYSTPPITFCNVIQYVKNRDHADTYLLLKDIFPQNAVDIGMLQKTGLKSFLYRYFRKKERKLYQISNRIGCMSQANVEYILRHNGEISADCVEVCPNSVEPLKRDIDEKSKIEIRTKYKIPTDKTVFMYGGNLGKPQDIPFIIECLHEMKDDKDCFFVICGSGSEYRKLKDYVEREKPSHFLLIQGLPKEEYEKLLSCCDVGLLFLDHRFTIPNFPSRILSYMEYAMPVLACTDASTDVGEVVTTQGFGYWCESNDSKAFARNCKCFCQDAEKNRDMGMKGRQYLEQEYSSRKTYDIICGRVNLNKHEEK